MASILDYRFGNKRARRLKTLAKAINDSGKFRAEITEGYCNTDRKIPGSRLIIPGKGRQGNKLVVRHLDTDRVVFEHNAAGTYRHNGEVEVWVAEHIDGNGCNSPFCPVCEKEPWVR